MTDAILVEQELEPGETERAKALFEQIGQLDGEGAVAALRKEGVYTESAFLQRREEGDFVLYYIEAEDGEQVKDVFDAILADPEGELAAAEDGTDAPEGETDELVAFVREFDAVTAGEPRLADVEFLYHLVNPERPASA